MNLNAGWISLLLRFRYDEFIFAEKEVFCVGQIIGAILAKDQESRKHIICWSIFRKQTLELKKIILNFYF